MERFRRFARSIRVGRGARMPPPPKAPQEWRLAPKRAVAANALIKDRNDLIGRFFLGMSLAFNDLKGLVMFEQYLKAMGRPATADFSPHFGQWHGVNVQIQRWIVGVLHEIMNVIDAKQYKSVVDGAELKVLVGSVDLRNRQAWNSLVAVARAPSNQPGMAAVLLRIRNDAAFHYDYRGRGLSDAYTELFGRIAAAAPAESNNGAQFSLGVDMDATRFYFADAAAQQVMNTQLLQNQATIEDVFAFGLEVNLALAALIGAFIRSRET